MPNQGRSRRSRELVNTATGEVHELWEPDDEVSRRRSYSFGQFGQFSFERVLAMLGKESGLTGDDVRVFFYCGIKTYTQGGATAKEAAEYLGLTPQATRRIAKKLAENKIFLVAEVVGRSTKYKASPHIVSSLTGAEQSEEAAAYHLPTLPGRPGASKGKPSGTSSKSAVPRTRSSARADQGPAAPQADRSDAVRDQGGIRSQRRNYGGRAG